MKTRLVRVGNSRGVRLPKVLIEEAGLPEEIEIKVRGRAIIIAPRRAPRSGWADAARKLRSEGGDRLLDAPTPTRFDETEWQW